LANHDYEVTMVTSFPYYPHWKVQEPYSGRFYKKEILMDGNLTLYRCPLYVPSKPTGARRLLQEVSFFLSAFLVIVRLLFKKKNDVVVCISPPFHLGFLALFYRFFKGSPVIYHVQDLQIEAAKELKILKSNFVFNTLFAMEKIILNKVNSVSTISDGMLKKIKAKTKNKVLFFPNWVDTMNYFPVSSMENLKGNWGFSKNDKIVLYSGSIGEKQGLDSLINICIKTIDYEEIKFVICGTGPYKNKLIQLAKDANLTNIYFLPLQDNHVFNDFLNIADVHLVIQKENASDLVMPSKLTTILSVGGLAIVTANLDTTLGDVITEHKMGVVTRPEDEEGLLMAILKCCRKDYSEERFNARKYAEIFLSKESIMQRFENEITSYDR